MFTGFIDGFGRDRGGENFNPKYFPPFRVQQNKRSAVMSFKHVSSEFKRLADVSAVLANRSIG